LYTWQNPEWDITEEKRDPCRGKEVWREDVWTNLQPLYARLEQKIGTRDFLWCYPAYEHWMKHEIRRLWVLDVPSAEIFQFLDSHVWSDMVQKVIDDEQYEDRLWNKVILGRHEGITGLTAENNSGITPLVHVPLSPSIRVIDKNRFNKGIRHSHARYEDLPTSVCDAQKCRDEGPKPGDWRQRGRERNSLKRKRLDDANISD
jgi:hypothetical protein